MSETPHQDDPRSSVTDEEIQRAMAVDSLPEQVERSAEGSGSNPVQLSDGSLVDEDDLEDPPTDR